MKGPGVYIYEDEEIYSGLYDEGKKYDED